MISRRSVALAGAVMVVTMVHGVDARADDTKVQIWAPRDAQSSGALIIANEKGFFKKAGLESEVKFVSSGQEIPAGMAGGTISLACASWTNPMAMNANGVPVKVISKIADISPALGVVVRGSAGIHVPKDLEGKKIGITSVSILNDEKRMLAVLSVEVTFDIEGLRKSLAAHAAPDRHDAAGPAQRPPRRRRRGDRVEDRAHRLS